jgi:cyanate lyase
MQDLACWCNGVPKQHIYTNEVVYKIYELLKIYEQLCEIKQVF